MTRRSRASLAIAAALFLGVFASQRGALDAGFVFDDGPYVRDNAHVGGGPTPGNVRWAFTTTLTSNWQPLTWLSLQLDARLFGAGPRGHHAVNVLLHAANAAALSLVLAGLTGARWPSAAAAALFALHPLRVESVAWISERKDVLSALLFLAALAIHRRHASRPRFRTAAALAAVFALGLMAKPMLVTLPLVLLVLDWWPLNRRPGRVLLVEKLPLFALAAASCVATLWAQGAGGALRTLATHPPATRIANALVGYPTYLGKTLWPADLAVFYPYPWRGLTAATVAAAIALLAGVTAVAIRARRGHPWPLAGWLWYLGMLVPVIGLVQVGGQAGADRYTYLPAIGVLVAAAWGTAALVRQPTAKRRAALAAAATAATFTVMTGAQLAHWRTERSLFEHALRATGGNWLAHNWLGVLDMGEQRYDDARRHFEASLRLAPRNNPQAHSNLGDLEVQRGRMAEAVRHYETVIQLDAASPDDRLNLGVALASLGRSEEAAEQYREALRSDPSLADAHYNLGNLFARDGRHAEAIERYREAVRLDPRNHKAHNNWALALQALGRSEEARARLAEASRLRPSGTAGSLVEGGAGKR